MVNEVIDLHWKKIHVLNLTIWQHLFAFQIWSISNKQGIIIMHFKTRFLRLNKNLNICKNSVHFELDFDTLFKRNEKVLLKQSKYIIAQMKIIYPIF